MIYRPLRSQRKIGFDGTTPELKTRKKTREGGERRGGRGGGDDSMSHWYTITYTLRRAEDVERAQHSLPLLLDEFPPTIMEAGLNSMFCYVSMHVNACTRKHARKFTNRKCVFVCACVCLCLLWFQPMTFYTSTLRGNTVRRDPSVTFHVTPWSAAVFAGGLEIKSK